MADNNKVTIDADYFAELWKIANEADEVCEDCVREKCGECKVVKERDELLAVNEDLKSRVVSYTERKHFAKLEDDYIAVCKERDELRAKLEEVNRTTVVCLNNEIDALKSKNKSLTSFLDDTQTKLEAAERCIEDCWGHIACGPAETIPTSRGAIEDIIRAYRAAKEAR